MLITGPARRAVVVPGASGQKFTEPVAFSSTAPTNLWLAPMALGNGFGLLTLRARCTQQRSDGVRGRSRPGSRGQPQFAAIGWRRRGAESPGSGYASRARPTVAVGALARRVLDSCERDRKGDRDGNHGKYRCRAARDVSGRGFRQRPAAGRRRLRRRAPHPQRTDRPAAGADRALPERRRRRGRGAVRPRRGPRHLRPRRRPQRRRAAQSPTTR